MRWGVRKGHISLILSAAALALAGCAPALRQAPTDAAIDIPSQWAYADGKTAGAATGIAAQWWQALGDTALDGYVQAALARNANLQVAGTRVAATWRRARAGSRRLAPARRASHRRPSAHRRGDASGSRVRARRAWPGTSADGAATAQCDAAR